MSPVTETLKITQNEWRLSTLLEQLKQEDSTLFVDNKPAFVPNELKG